MHGSGWRSTAITGGLVLTIVAISHQLTYLLAHGGGDGFSAAMRASGHDGYWPAFVVAVAAAIGLIAAVGIGQVALLWRAAERLGPSATVGIDATAASLGSLVARRAVSLGVLSVAAYVAQENLELVAMGQDPPMVAVLAHHGGAALPVLAVVSLAVAAAASIVRWKRRLLVWRLVQARRSAPVRRSRRRPLVVLDRPVIQATGRRNFVRGPPVILAQAT